MYKWHGNGILLGSKKRMNYQIDESQKNYIERSQAQRIYTV